jgi:hypothetical protein
MPDNSAPTPDSASAPSPQKKSPFKLLFRLFIVFVLLVIIGLVALFLSADGLVRAGIVRGGKYATDQDTLLDSAKLSFAAGTLNLSQLNIHNIQDSSNTYKEPSILSIGSCDVVVDSPSLLTHTVTVSSIDIRGMEFWLEQNGAKNNLADLMEILKKNTSAADTTQTANSAGTPAPPPQPPGKELKIGKINIVGTKVHIRGILKADFDLPAIQMEDPTNPDGRPMKIADLVGKILISLAKQIMENPQVPANIKDAMKNVDKLVGDLRGQLDKEMKNKLGNTIQDIGKNIDPGKILKDAPKIPNINIPGMPGAKTQPK